MYKQQVAKFNTYNFTDVLENVKLFTKKNPGRNVKKEKKEQKEKRIGNTSYTDYLFYSQIKHATVYLSPENKVLHLAKSTCTIYIF